MKNTSKYIYGLIILPRQEYKRMRGSHLPRP